MSATLHLAGPAGGTSVLVATTATPSPPPPAERERFEVWEGSPGIVGFLVTIAAVVACIPLFISMSRKLRRVRYDEERHPGDLADGTGPEGPGADGGRPPARP